MKKMAIFIFIVGVVFLPWGVKNIVYYHNPLYPVFPGGKDLFLSAAGLDCGKNFLENCSEDMYFTSGESNTNEIFIISNLRVLLKWNFIKVHFWLTNLGPWFFFALPLTVFYFFKSKETYLRFIVLTSIIYFVFWAIFFSGQGWYLLPTAVGVLLVLFHIMNERIFLCINFVLKLLIICWTFSLLTPMAINIGRDGRLEYILGEIGIGEAIERVNKELDNNKNDYYKTWMYIDDNVLNDKDKHLVYSFMDTQGYFINDSYKNYVPDFFGYIESCASTPERVYGALTLVGVDHIIIDEETFDTCSDKSKSNFKICFSHDIMHQVLQKHGEEIHRENSVVLFRLK